MPLELSPLPAADLRHYEDIVTAAFADSLQTVFYPDGVTAEARAATLAGEQALWERTAAELAARGPEEAISLHYMRVVDTELAARGDDPRGGVVGVSKWMVHPRARSDEEMAAEEAAGAAARPLPPGINVDCLAAFKTALKGAKRDIFGGRPYIILHVLVTHPSHHRRGVGALHLQWGERLADRLGLPLYLEASAMGKPLYERWGYQEVMKIPFDARDWGAAEEMAHVAMVRPAKGGKKPVNGSV